jgi:hypothetical protein
MGVKRQVHEAGLRRKSSVLRGDVWWCCGVEGGLSGTYWKSPTTGSLCHIKSMTGGARQMVDEIDVERGGGGRGLPPEAR